MTLVLLSLLIALVALVIVLRKQPWMAKALAWLWALRNEWMALPVAFIMLVLSPWLMRVAFGSTTGTFDLSILQTLFIAALELVVTITTAHLFTSITYRRIFKQTKETPINIPWYVALFAFYFVAYLALVVAFPK